MVLYFCCTSLSQPFDRAVALFVLNLIAAHQTYVIEESTWVSPDGKRTENLDLTEKVVTDTNSVRLDKTQMAIIEQLHVSSSTCCFFFRVLLLSWLLVSSP